MKKKELEAYKQGLLEGNRGMPRITEKEYLAYLKIIRDQLKYEELCIVGLNTLLPNDEVTGFDNLLLIPLITLLETLTNDSEGWLSYYVFECDMGETPGKVMIGGLDMKLDCDSKLWMLITYK